MQKVLYPLGQVIKIHAVFHSLDESIHILLIKLHHWSDWTLEVNIALMTQKQLSVSLIA